MTAPTSYSFQWSRDGNAIPGATSETYRLQAADEDRAMTCTLVATNSDASVRAVTLPTALVAGAVAVETAPFSVGVSMGADLALFGLADHGLSKYAAIGAAGFSTVRLEAGYTADHSVYNDASIRSALAAGLHVLLILDAYDITIGVAAFASFCASVVTTYAALGCHDYEILNEENWYVNWDTSAEQTVDPGAYATLLKASYAAVKAADSASTVIMGGIATFADSDGASLGSGKYSGSVLPTTFMTQVYAALGGTSSGAFDAVAVHPYTFPQVPTGNGDNFGQALSPAGLSVRTIMAANGDSDKKIWVTEFGAPTGSDDGQTVDVSQAVQAQSFSAALDMCSGYSYVGAFYCFNWNDDQDGDFGLNTSDYVAKPALAEVISYIKKEDS